MIAQEINGSFLLISGCLDLGVFLIAKDNPDILLRSAYNQVTFTLPISSKMNSEKVVFGFFIVLALTLNFGFFLGGMTDISHHSVYELYAAIVVSLIATILKFGDSSHIGAVFLSTSLVADLQLVAAAVVWGVAEHASSAGVTEEITSMIVSLSGGALLANITSVILLISETLSVRR